MKLINIAKYTFVIIFYGVLLTLILGWLWTKFFNQSILDVSKEVQECPKRTLSVALKPLQEGICFHHVLKKRQGDKFTYQMYSFFGKSCGEVDVVCDSYVRDAR